MLNNMQEIMMWLPLNEDIKCRKGTV